MLTITPIKNVQNTINKNISFTAGVQTNAGTNAINNAADIKHEGSLLGDFKGTLKQSPLRNIFQRQISIQKGLESEQQKLNALA